jgi:hypothetical protein
VVGNLSWKNSLAYGTLNVKIFYQHEAHTKLSKLGGGGTMSLGQFNFGGGQWVVTIMICNNTKLSIVPQARLFFQLKFVNFRQCFQ